ncbi:MAG TPA: YceI family protein [Bacteroidales bacterium]|nr:YceI family protein [Bacteroidales bacterium]HRZ76054.1 YceI family protein [Bacteroidales bacterium]
MQTTPHAIATAWSLDPTHSEVQFKVRHLVISTVTGYFRSFGGTFRSPSEDFDGAEVSFTIDVDSIDTNVADRDAHLKSDDFFNAATFPRISFNGILNKKDEGSYTLTGPLSIRDNTRDVVLDVELGGVMTDPWGNVKAGFEVSGKVSRKEFGLMWNAVTEAGGVVVGDEVKMLINVQWVRQSS